MKVASNVEGFVTVALTAGLLGLFGTVIGAALTTWTTRQTAARSERRAWVEGRRQEYRSAVTEFAGALLSYRVAERDRWLARHETSTTNTVRAGAAMPHVQSSSWDDPGGVARLPGTPA